MKLNERVNECVRNLSSMKLLAKFIVGDVVSQEFKYHPACLVGLYNRERDHLNAIKQEQSLKSSAFEWYPSICSELVSYITDMKTTSEGTDAVIFKLTDLASLYKQ